MMYRSREKLNEAKSPLVMINGRGRFKNHVKNHTREAVLDRMQSSGNATGFATGCSVTHQLPWEQRAITGAFERFFFSASTCWSEHPQFTRDRHCGGVKPVLVAKGQWLHWSSGTFPEQHSGTQE